MIYAIGLPRCGGQSLCEALAILTGSCVHSPGSNPIVAASAVEVFRQPRSILRNDPDARFIINMRHEAEWIASCEAVYRKSEDWNHPLWKYPLADFADYRREYLQTRVSQTLGQGVSTMVIWLDEYRWEPLCRFLDVSIPDVPFPTVDRVRR